MRAGLLPGATFSVTGEMPPTTRWGAHFGLPSHAVPAGLGPWIHLGDRSRKPIVVCSEDRTERTHVLDRDDGGEADIVLSEIFVWGV